MTFFNWPSNSALEQSRLRSYSLDLQAEPDTENGPFSSPSCSSPASPSRAISHLLRYSVQLLRAGLLAIGIAFGFLSTLADMVSYHAYLQNDKDSLKLAAELFPFNYELRTRKLP